MTRREFSKPTREAAHRRSGGVCECHLLAKAGIPGFKAEGCGCTLGPGNTFYEHIIQDGAGGEPTLENCAVLTKTCWRLKTDTIDAPVVAKVIRQHQRDIGIGRRNGPPMDGSRNSRFRRRMNGAVEVRR